MDLEAECFDRSNRLVLTLLDPSILLFDDQLIFIRLASFRSFRIIVLLQAEESERSNYRACLQISMDSCRFPK